MKKNYGQPVTRVVKVKIKSSILESTQTGQGGSGGFDARKGAWDSEWNED